MGTVKICLKNLTNLYQGSDDRIKTSAIYGIYCSIGEYIFDISCLPPIQLRPTTRLRDAPPLVRLPPGASQGRAPPRRDVRALVSAADPDARSTPRLESTRHHARSHVNSPNPHLVFLQVVIAYVVGLLGSR